MPKIKPLVALVVALGFALPLASASAQTAAKTLENLQTSYNGETNAHAKYIKFADQADNEGFGKVGSLFRAAAVAEGIHRACEAAAIRELGATPRTEVKLPPIKSTRQNLEDSANKGEAYERDTMYPRFIKQAHQDGIKDAAQCFEWARAAEAEHFKLFSAAANNLDQMKGGPGRYYVCTDGGYTMAKLDTARCPDGDYDETR